MLVEILEICKIGKNVISSGAKNLINKLNLKIYRFLTPSAFADSVRNDINILIF